MIQEIGKGIKKEDFVKLIKKHLKQDKNNQAYERSLYYILNATRRGGLVAKIGKEVLVFAKSYDKPNSLSIIFFSNPDIVSSKNLTNLFKENFPRKEIFIHHLFEKRAKEIISSFEGAKIINKTINEKINSYPDEDTYPQIVYPLHLLPAFNNSAFLKIKHLQEILSKKSSSEYKADILEYLNSTKRKLNEPEIFTILIEKGMSNKINPLLNHIISHVINGWKKQQKDKIKDFDEYYIKPILNLIKLLLNKKLLDNSKNKIIFRAAFDLKLNKGGFWIGELIPSKSLLIPHVILTDHYYREQYRFLLYDIISYCYQKNINYVNFGGSEEKKMFNIKLLPKIFFHTKNITRKIYSTYIPK